MACAGLLLGISVAVGTAANLGDPVRDNPLPLPASHAVENQAPHPANRGIDLSVAGALHNPAIASSSAPIGSAGSSESRWENGNTPGFSIGPVRTEFGGVSGRHMHLATIKLQGLSVFGGSVGASVDSRSARFSLSWSTSP